jgi:MtrB/PioB family decaheme-associated outer membrane protein
MKNTTHLFLLLMLSAPAATAVAADSSAAGGESKPVDTSATTVAADSESKPVDTSQWKCKYCAFEEGLSGTVDAGLGYVSDHSYKFGEYNGLNREGTYFIGDANARFRGEDAAYWNIDASDLGLGTRYLSAEGGKQGKYTTYLKYKELPHYISDTVQTPFWGNGSGSLNLPAGWVNGATTAGMTSLPGSLNYYGLSTHRERLDVGGSLIGAGHWEYGVNFRHETKGGTQRIAGTFLFNSAQLVEPVDYVTDQLDASASFTGGKLQAKFAYYASTFSNNIDTLTWQNPYTTGIGATAGQLTLPPDNQFHQVLATLGYQFSKQTRATADIAFGRMTQDDNYNASTLNSTLAVPALPQNSLDGKVDTTNANAKIVSAVTDKLRLNAAYTYNDHDNKTPQSAYPWVTTDTFVNSPRTNLPYSFTQNTLKLSADYRVTTHVKASVGYDYDKNKRTYQETDDTRENTFWGRVIARTREDIDLTFRVLHGQRDQSNYTAVPEVTPPDNPLLVKYYMANRTRNSAGFRLDAPAGQVANFGFGVDYSRDDYPDSKLGLTNGNDLNISADVSVILSRKTSMHFFVNHEQIYSKQAGSDTFSTADWFGENNDTVNVLGFGVKRAVMTKKLDVGADYTVSQSHGSVTVDSAVSAPPFPDISSRLDSLKLYATYRLKDNMSLQGAYWYERLQSENWALDGVTPNTIPNVLAFGEQPPNYHVNVISLALRYKFK